MSAKEAEAEAFEKEKDLFKSKLLEQRREEVYRRWLQDTKKRADMEYIELEEAMDILERGENIYGKDISPEWKLEQLQNIYNECGDVVLCMMMQQERVRINMDILKNEIKQKSDKEKTK